MKKTLAKVMCGMLVITMVGCSSKEVEEQQEVQEQQEQIEVVNPIEEASDKKQEDNNNNSNSVPKNYIKKVNKHRELEQPENDNGYEYEDGILLNKQHGDHLEEEAQKQDAEEEVEDSIGDEGEAWHINNDNEEEW